MNRRILALLAVGHMTTDVYQGALPGLLPFLKDAYHLTYAQTGTIVLVMQAASSIIQPLFGYLSDRAERFWLMPVGVAVAALGITTMGAVPTYAGCLLLVTVGSLGVAAFHPQAYKTAHQVAGDRRATGMSLFTVGGNVGHALGPLFITYVVLTFGLGHAYVGMVPGLVIAALLLWAILTAARRLRAAASGAAAPGTSGAVAAAAGTHPPIPWGPLVFLIMVVSLRSWAQIALSSYIPLFYRDHLGESPVVAGTVLLVYLLAGAAGTLVGGPVADRYGPRHTLALSLFLTTPLLAIFPHVRGPLALVVVGLAGFVLVSTFSLTIVVSQSLLPTRGGTAAGLMVGFAVGAGGTGVAVLGLVADRWNLLAAMHVLAAVPLLALPFVWALPADTPAPARDLRAAKIPTR